MTNASEILAAARRRGLEQLDRWVAEGILVDAAEASRLRGTDVTSSPSEGLVLIVHRGSVRYLASVLELEAAAVASVNRHLAHASDSQRLIWWRRPHGALGGLSIVEGIRTGRIERCIELARAYADERLAGDGTNSVGQ